MPLLPALLPPPEQPADSHPVFPQGRADPVPDLPPRVHSLVHGSLPHRARAPERGLLPPGGPSGPAAPRPVPSVPGVAAVRPRSLQTRALMPLPTTATATQGSPPSTPTPRRPDDAPLPPGAGGGRGSGEPTTRVRVT